MPEKIQTRKSYAVMQNRPQTFEWRLKIKPEASNRLGLHQNSNISRFDARLFSDIMGQSYINPFTQKTGNWRVGTHLPIEFKH